MKTLAIIGAGKGLGLSLAKRFGKEGFQIALVARNAVKLQEMVTALNSIGIEASYFTADIYSKEQIEQAISAIKNKYGQIDVVEVSPVPGNYPPASVLELTIENARDAFEGFAASSINIVNAVLPDMLKKQEGALLFTTGFSSLHPFPMMGNIGVGLGTCATISPIFILNCYLKVFSSVTVHWVYSFQNRGRAKLVIRILLLTCGINPIATSKSKKANSGYILQNRMKGRTAENNIKFFSYDYGV